MDWDKVVEITNAAIREEGDPRSVFNFAIQRMRSDLSETECDELSSLDPGEALDELHGWFESVLLEDAPPVDSPAYWFGVFTGVWDELESGRALTIYASTSYTYDADDENFEWACDPKWMPDSAYAVPPYFIALCNWIRKQESRSGWDWHCVEQCLVGVYLAVLARELLSSAPINLVLGDQVERPLAVGYDAGDGFLVGSMTRDGFCRPS